MSITTRIPESVSLRLTDYLSPAALQELQDGLTAVTGLEINIVDPEGRPVTDATPCPQWSVRDNAMQEAIDEDASGLLDGPITAPIVVDERRLGAIVLTGQRLDEICDAQRLEIRQLAERFGLTGVQMEEFAGRVEQLADARRADAVRFIHLLADALGQVCRQDMALQQRVDRMTMLYHLSTLLAGQRELQQVLDTVTKSAAEVLNVKAASIRLLDDEERELLPKSVYNLSREYLNKGPVLLSGSPIDLQATSGEVVYVSDMASDPRILYPADAAREGLASILVVGLVYRGRKVGVMRIYSDQVRQFSEDERQLLRAVAQLSAAAIEHARLDEARQQAERVRRQVQLAADVQRRMMPTSKTHMPPFDIAARYEPCFELGGDFFDLIPIERTLGLVVGDVVGKGVAAGLLMASVRASLRAYIEDVYDLDEIMAKVNAAMTRETRDDEFATVFYGTLDADSLRLTYCSAGHDPALLLRDGQFTELGIGGMAVGVSREQRYEKGLITLRGGDVLLMHTDGVTDAMNFGGEKFGRQRLHQAVLDAAEQDAQSIVNHVLWEVRRFIGLNAPSDDITLLAVKVDPGYRANAYMI